MSRRVKARPLSEWQCATCLVSNVISDTACVKCGGRAGTAETGFARAIASVPVPGDDAPSAAVSAPFVAVSARVAAPLRSSRSTGVPAAGFVSLGPDGVVVAVPANAGLRSSNSSVRSLITVPMEVDFGGRVGDGGAAVTGAGRGAIKVTRLRAAATGADHAAIKVTRLRKPTLKAAALAQAAKVAKALRSSKEQAVTTAEASILAAALLDPLHPRLLSPSSTYVLSADVPLPASGVDHFPVSSAIMALQSESSGSSGCEEIGVRAGGDTDGETTDEEPSGRGHGTFVGSPADGSSSASQACDDNYSLSQVSGMHEQFEGLQLGAGFEAQAPASAVRRVRHFADPGRLVESAPALDAPPTRHHQMRWPDAARDFSDQALISGAGSRAAASVSSSSTHASSLRQRDAAYARAASAFEYASGSPAASRQTSRSDTTGAPSRAESATSGVSVSASSSRHQSSVSRIVANMESSRATISLAVCTRVAFILGGRVGDAQRHFHDAVTDCRELDFSAFRTSLGASDFNVRATECVREAAVIILKSGRFDKLSREATEALWRLIGPALSSPVAHVARRTSRSSGASSVASTPSGVWPAFNDFDGQEGNFPMLTIAAKVFVRFPKAPGPAAADGNIMYVGKAHKVHNQPSKLIVPTDSVQQSSPSWRFALALAAAPLPEYIFSQIPVQARMMRAAMAWLYDTVDPDRAVRGVVYGRPNLWAFLTAPMYENGVTDYSVKARRAAERMFQIVPLLYGQDIVEGSYGDQLCSALELLGEHVRGVVSFAEERQLYDAFHTGIDFWYRRRAKDLNKVSAATILDYDISGLVKSVRQRLDAVQPSAQSQACYACPFPDGVLPPRAPTAPKGVAPKVVAPEAPKAPKLPAKAAVLASRVDSDPKVSLSDQMEALFPGSRKLTGPNQAGLLAPFCPFFHVLHDCHRGPKCFKSHAPVPVSGR